ncbi:hypothetical protein QTI04_31400 [Variovorax sp. J22R115]|nr:hypothetical protein [Variovorax sp. J22R115]MDM0053532.1 hypothetical protein [Variovorax sp. J22R115]
MRSGSFQSQSQGSGYNNGQAQTSYDGGGQQQGNGNFGPASLFVPGTTNDWWPTDLRFPNSTGAQNGVSYAYFAQARRLAIEVNGRVTVYDTLDHQIGGFGQQQSYGGSLSFNSQYGLIDVASLPVISVDGVSPNAAPPAPAFDEPVNPPASVNNGNGHSNAPPETSRTCSPPSSGSPTCAPRASSATTNSPTRRRSCSAGYEAGREVSRPTARVRSGIHFRAGCNDQDAKEISAPTTNARAGGFEQLGRRSHQAIGASLEVLMRRWKSVQKLGVCTAPAKTHTSNAHGSAHESASGAKNCLVERR